VIRGGGFGDLQVGVEEQKHNLHTEGVLRVSFDNSKWKGL